jgi:hypothetical protein
MLPLSRREVCDSCNADQHVCRLCKYYDPSISDQCREDRADSVTAKDKANFCDYFSTNPQAYQTQAYQTQAYQTQAYQNKGTPQNQAKAKLDALFGDESGDTAVDSSPQSKADAAKKALDDLFK